MTTSVRTVPLELNQFNSIAVCWCSENSWWFSCVFLVFLIVRDCKRAMLPREGSIGHWKKGYYFSCYHINISVNLVRTMPVGKSASLNYCLRVHPVTSMLCSRWYVLRRKRVTPNTIQLWQQDEQFWGTEPQIAMHKCIYWLLHKSFLVKQVLHTKALDLICVFWRKHHTPTTFSLLGVVCSTW